MLKTYVETLHRVYVIEDCSVKDLKEDIDYYLRHNNIFISIGDGDGGIDWINIYHITRMWEKQLDEEWEDELDEE